MLRPQARGTGIDKEEVSLDRLEAAPPPPESTPTNGPRAPSPQPTAGDDLVLRQILVHRQIPNAPAGHYEFLCQWVGFPVGEDTSWEPIKNLRHGQVQRYCRRKKLDDPPNMEHARAGLLTGHPLLVFSETVHPHTSIEPLAPSPKFVMTRTRPAPDTESIKPVAAALGAEGPSTQLH